MSTAPYSHAAYWPVTTMCARHHVVPDPQCDSMHTHIRPAWPCVYVRFGFGHSFAKWPGTPQLKQEPPAVAAGRVRGAVAGGAGGGGMPGANATECGAGNM